MAQLIKLSDYISRYELDIYRYPSQYIRLKKEKWDKLYLAWEENEDTSEPVVDTDQDSHHNLLSKFNIFRKKDKRDKKEEKDIQEPSFKLPVTKEELKKHFLNQLFPFQLKWATSSISSVSFMDQSYKNDLNLKYFLKRFPDNYFIMYDPVFIVKRAPVDAETILISPIGVEIVYLLNDYSDATILVSDDRTWEVEKDNKQKKILSPVQALKRTEQLVQSILNKDDLSFPIQKTVLTKENTVIFHQKPFNTRVIGKREYEEWFKSKRLLDSPLKRGQLKVAEQLLKYCLTTSVRRPEWEDENDAFYTVGKN